MFFSNAVLITSSTLFFVVFVFFVHYTDVQEDYPHKSGIKGYLKYLVNELKYKIIGDKRSASEKNIQRCRILESDKLIHIADSGER